jgi:hypothetical protein
MLVVVDRPHLSARGSGASWLHYPLSRLIMHIAEQLHIGSSSLPPSGCCTILSPFYEKISLSEEDSKWN